MKKSKIVSPITPEQIIKLGNSGIGLEYASKNPTAVQYKRRLTTIPGAVRYVERHGGNVRYGDVEDDIEEIVITDANDNIVAVDGSLFRTKGYELTKPLKPSIKREIIPFVRTVGQHLRNSGVGIDDVKISDSTVYSIILSGMIFPLVGDVNYLNQLEESHQFGGKVNIVTKSFRKLMKHQPIVNVIGQFVNQFPPEEISNLIIQSINTDGTVNSFIHSFDSKTIKTQLSTQIYNGIQNFLTKINKQQ